MMGHPQRGPSRGAMLVVKVSIISELSAIGKMFIMAVHLCTTTYSAILKKNCY